MQRELEALGLSKKCLNQLWFRLDLRGSLERVQQQFTSRRPSEAARQALHELTTVIEYADKLEVSCPLVVHPGECGPSLRPGRGRGVQAGPGPLCVCHTDCVCCRQF